jgi:hypothetical protein
MLDRFRWWLASIFACWAHDLTEPETGAEPVWPQKIRYRLLEGAQSRETGC